jgi:hypothetical protein
VHRPDLGGGLVDRREEAREPLAGARALALRFLELLEEEVVAAPRELLRDLLLGREVVEEGLARDVGALADLLDRGRREAALAEEVRGRLRDPIGGLLAAALAAAEGCS